MINKKILTRAIKKFNEAHTSHIKKKTFNDLQHHVWSLALWIRLIHNGDQTDEFSQILTERESGMGKLSWHRNFKGFE